MRFWVGANAPSRKGEAEGITLLQAAEADSPWASGPLSLSPTVAQAPGSPSWIAAHPALEVVYAALEADGAVQAYRRTGDTTLARLGRPVEAGSGVCHVAVSPDGAFLLASCWNDGRLVRMPLDAAGQPSAPSIAPAAVDPYGPGASPSREISSSAISDLADAARALREAAGEEFAHLIPDHEEADAAERERSGEDDPVVRGAGRGDEAPALNAGDEEPRPSRAHQSVFLGGGLVATTDMGLDLVRFWRVGEGGLRFVQEVVFPLGSGPRHTVWHPSGHLYVLTELSREVFALAPDRAGRWRIVSGVSLNGSVEGDTAAELASSADGETLYAGVRGTNTIGVVRVSGAGADLHQSALVDAGTNWPRNHVVVRDTILVAGQRASEVVSLLIDERTGIPGRVGHRIAVASPTCLLPTR